MSKNSASQNGGFVIHPEDFLKFISVTASNAAQYFDCCFVPVHPHLLAEPTVLNDLSGLLTDVTKQLLKKGISCRFITEVTIESLGYWKKFIVRSQIRHVDFLGASFALSDREQYWGFAIETGDAMQNKYNNNICCNPAAALMESQLLLYSNNKSFIDMQQFLFDNLWNNAIPIKQRIVHLEREQISSIANQSIEPERIFADCMRYLRSAVYEILVILPNTEAARFIGDRGILDLLKSALQNGVDVKILTHIEAGKVESDYEVLRITLREKLLEKNMNYLYRGLDSQDMTVVIDQAVSFSLEIGNKLDSKNHMPAIIGASCSNDDSILSFNTSMFESLWIQSEFEKQNKIKQVYFQMFKGLKLKNEKYNRKWSSNQNPETDDKQ